MTGAGQFCLFIAGMCISGAMYNVLERRWLPALALAVCGVMDLVAAGAGVWW